MCGIHSRVTVGIALVICVIATAVRAEDATVETLLSELQAPRGVAVRPSDSAERYEVFVSDTGAGRVIKLQSDQLNKSVDAITGFATSTEGNENPGPFGLFFLDRKQLVVACGAAPVVRLYQIADPVSLQKADMPIAQVDNSAVQSAWSISRTRENDKVPDLLVVTCGRLGLGKIPVRAGTLGELTQLAAKDSSADIGLPVGIAVSEQGFIVAAHDALSADTPRSAIAFYNPIDGAQLMTASVELEVVMGLAYSPKTGNLYAIDFAPHREAEGGVYRIDDASEPGKPACRAVKVAAVARPSALAFGPDGVLFVTAFGKLKNGRPNNGVLLKITGEL